ncbi:MAG: MotA/TolQ/ExbB proton channel family protein [Candidatus Hydrogenedentes bacterium]|nr:MotA/TolQ/ExbB proton channel family protein [Candidatus Hydrogenedentota bacterium]
MFHMLRQGGLLMVPLALCSIAALTIIIERWLALRRDRILDSRLLRLLDEYDGDQSAEAAIMLCRRVGGPFSRILEEILKARHLDHTQVLETMHATGRTQIGVLERGLTLLEIIAGVSPLLGLLGTVLGLVNIFDAITTAGIGNAQALSDGIAKALITTIAGLTVAIPALAAHSWFSKRVDDLATEMQDRATGFIAKLYAIQRRKAVRQ